MGISDPQWEAYQSGRPIGIDLKRSVIDSNLGTYVVNASTAFRAGMLVALNSSQELVINAGTTAVGFAKYDVATALYETVVDEYIQLNGTTATSLANANLYAGNGIRVDSAAQGTGTTYTVTTDYTVNATNGTVTRVGGGSITDGQYVYVTYMYEIPNSQMQFEGKNFWNVNNAIEYTNARMTVITGQSIVFTSQYDPSQVYAVDSVVEAGVTGDSLSGLVTLTGVGTGPNIGTVIQVPSAADPFMGIRMYGLRQ
jgi:hypothetical protein